MSVDDLSAVEAFRTLLSNKGGPTPDIPEDIDENEHYLRFLRAKNLAADKAVELYQRYHDMRLKHKEIFCKMTPSLLRHVFESGVVTKLCGTDNEGRAIFLFRFKLWNTKEMTMDEVYLACVLLLEEISSRKEFQQNGVVMIHDYEGFNFSHFRQMTMRNFMRILQIMQGTFPLKFKAFHELNQPYLFYILYKIFYPLVPQKLRKRIFMYGSNTELLVDHFPQSSLPNSLGGTAEGFSDDNFMAVLFQRERYYEQMVLPLK